MRSLAIAALRVAVLGFAAAAVAYGQPNIWGGDYQTSSVDYVNFPQPLQVRTQICIDQPCPQYSVTFTTPDIRYGGFCPSSPCQLSTSITVQNPTNSEIASVTLYVGSLAGSYLVSAVTRATTLYFHETNIAGAPANITATGGTPQSARIGSTYAGLQATVTDAYGNPNSGVLVAFTAPSPSGPTALFLGSSLTAAASTNSSGNAGSPYLVANTVGGAFTISGTVQGLTGAANFSLTNLIPVTIGTNPSGLSFSVDGANYSSQAIFDWAPGSRHRISTSSPQSGETGMRYVWDSWSDGGIMSHSITVPTATSNYTANFTTQYLLTTIASPSSGGTVGPATGFYNAGQQVALSAAPSLGYSFSGWSGTGSGSYTGTNAGAMVTMNGAIQETASFVESNASVTVGTSPPGLSFSVDGANYTAPANFNWVPGSRHVISTSSPQSGETGTRYVWGSWSDGGAMSHTITTPSGATSYTAYFTTQYLLTTIASPSSGGAVGPASGFYNAGQQVALSATPNSGYTFRGWSGTGSGSYTGTNAGAIVTMNGAIQETASFVGSNASVTVGTSPSGLSFSVDGANYSTPTAFDWAPGSRHTISTSSPQSGGTGTRYVWSSWSDGGAMSHTITAPSGAGAYTANFTTQYLLTTIASPSSGGTVGPASGFYNAGQQVALSATPNSGYSFGGWSGTGSGSYTGTNAAATVIMNGWIQETASFRLGGQNRRYELIGTWTDDGVYYLNSDTGAWTRWSSPASMVCAADVDGDGQDDLVGAWLGSGVWVRFTASGQWTLITPSVPDWIAAGDLNGDGRADIIGIWLGKLWGWDSATGSWNILSAGATMGVLGDLDRDGRADLIGVWPSQGGLWIKPSSTGQWANIASTPDWIAAADMNGDGKDDLLGIWGGEVWIRDSVSGNWDRRAEAGGATKVVAGDFDGDSKADLVGIWPSGVWVYYSSDGSWKRLSSSAGWIALGRFR